MSNPDLENEIKLLTEQLSQNQKHFAQLAQLEFTHQPREEILNLNKLKLYHYAPQTTKESKAFETPLLLVFSLVNRPEILDLTPDNSLLADLLQAGRDLYLLDWGYPDEEDKNLSFETYIQEYLKACVQHIIEKTPQRKVDLLGICQGGVFSICYAALNSEEIRRLILISTPIDFHQSEDVLSRLVKNIKVEQMIERTGNISGRLLAKIFAGLRPFHLAAKKYFTLLDKQNDLLWLKQFMLIEKWLLATPDLAGRAFADFVKKFYQENALIRNNLQLGQAKVELKSLKMPILNIMARDDHIVPLSASRALKKYIQSTDYHVKVLAAGHIGIYLSKKTQQQLSKLISTWLDEREFEEDHAQESGARSRPRNHRMDK